MQRDMTANDDQIMACEANDLLNRAQSRGFEVVKFFLSKSIGAVSYADVEAVLTRCDSTGATEIIVASLDRLFRVNTSPFKDVVGTIEAAHVNVHIAMAGEA